MPCWYFEKSELINTPSFRDGIESEKEARYRREGARFLMDCGNQMGLRYDTMATGVVFFHRFFMFHSFNEFPRYVMATCCLFLAGKVEETPKKCKDIVKAAKTYLEAKQLKKHSDAFGEDPIKEIMTYERILLQTIKFDLQIDHPYSYLLKYAKSLKGNQEQIRNMVQMAWTFINDSYCTTLSLQWEPEIIAIALMYLTSKLSKLEITDWIDKKENFKQNWWDQFVEGLGLDILEDICHQILDLYATQKLQQEQQQKSTNGNNDKRKTQISPPSHGLGGQGTPLNVSMNSSIPSSYNNLADATSPTSAKLMKRASDINNQVTTSTNGGHVGVNMPSNYYNQNNNTLSSDVYQMNSNYGGNNQQMPPFSQINQPSFYSNSTNNIQATSPHFHQSYYNQTGSNISIANHMQLGILATSLPPNAAPPTSLHPPPPPPPSHEHYQHYSQYNQPHGVHHNQHTLHSNSSDTNPGQFYSQPIPPPSSSHNHHNNHHQQHHNHPYQMQPHHTQASAPQPRNSALKTINLTDRLV